MQRVFSRLAALLSMLALPGIAAAAESGQGLDLTHHWAGFVAIAAFVIAYLLVMAEEFTDLRKSKPVMLAAGIIWGMIGYVYVQHGMSEAATQAVHGVIEEYAELLLFLIVAMTYVNAMTERNVFEALRSWLVTKGFGYRQLFWITGFLAFFISPVLDNLTTSLVMCAVAMAVGGSNGRFISLACINIVVGANAGGAFSPFGDITTLMVWQSGVIDFHEFFVLFIPALVNFVVPAACMHFAVPSVEPEHHGEAVGLKRGGVAVLVLFALTIVCAVLFHKWLELPPVLGMMVGLGLLAVYGYYLKMTGAKLDDAGYSTYQEAETGDVVPVDVFEYVARAEWDTLLFFYGVILCVGGLGFLGYLSMVSEALYVHWDPTYANVSIGVLSAIVDNIPIMAAVLEMMPHMSHGQWLLITMTAGVGGSLLSIGSAAGVALMGQARGKYTFFSHLKWSWAIGLGYVLSILTHLWINARFF